MTTPTGFENLSDAELHERINSIQRAVRRVQARNRRQRCKGVPVADRLYLLDTIDDLRYDLPKLRAERRKRQAGRDTTTAAI